MPFTPEQARAAAEKSAQVRRAKRERAALVAKAEASAAEGGAAQDGMAGLEDGSSAISDRVVLVRVPLDIGTVMRQLQKDAAGGDSGASRELRAWLSQFPPDDAAADASDLAAPQRAVVAAVLARALAEAEGMPANTVIREGTIDGFDALPTDGDAEPVGHPRGSRDSDSDRGSRPPTAIHEDLTPPTPPTAEDDGSHPVNGTEREALTRSASTAQEVDA